jgi:hypothetical protein
MSEPLNIRPLCTALAADSAEMNAHLEDIETQFRALGLGHAAIETTCGIIVFRKRLMLNDVPVQELTRQDRCSVARSLPALLESLVRNGEAELDRIREALAVIRPIAETLDKKDR